MTNWKRCQKSAPQNRLPRSVWSSENWTLRTQRTNRATPKDDGSVVQTRPKTETQASSPP